MDPLTKVLIIVSGHVIVLLFSYVAAFGADIVIEEISFIERVTTLPDI